MKRKRKTKGSALDAQLFNLFQDVYSDSASCEQAVKDARKAFSFIRSQDAVFSNDFDWEDGL